MKKLLILALLGGCATATTSELFRAADECGTEEHCEPLWAAYNKRLEWLEEKKKKQQCPAGFIYVTDQHRKGCMSREGVERWLGRM